MVQDSKQAGVSLTPLAPRHATPQAVFDRDPACDKYTQCVLYFKGFQAVQCHRIAHHLWGQGRKVRPWTFACSCCVPLRLCRSLWLQPPPSATTS